MHPAVNCPKRMSRKRAKTFVNLVITRVGVQSGSPLPLLGLARWKGGMLRNDVPLGKGSGLSELTAAKDESLDHSGVGCGLDTVPRLQAVSSGMQPRFFQSFIAGSHSFLPCYRSPCRFAAQGATAVALSRHCSVIAPCEKAHALQILGCKAVPVSSLFSHAAASPLLPRFCPPLFGSEAGQNRTRSHARPRESSEQRAAPRHKDSPRAHLLRQRGARQTRPVRRQDGIPTQSRLFLRRGPHVRCFAGFRFQMKSFSPVPREFLTAELPVLASQVSRCRSSVRSG